MVLKSFMQVQVHEEPGKNPSDVQLPTITATLQSPSRPDWLGGDNLETESHNQWLSSLYEVGFSRKVVPEDD